MSSTGQRRSNSLSVVLLMVFDFALISHTSSSGETCVNVNDRGVCYFKAWDFGVDWNSAWQLCNSRNSTLPVLRNRNEQDVFANYLNSHLIGSTVWTSGRSYTYENLTWLDGRPYSGPDAEYLSRRHQRYQPILLRGYRVVDVIDTNYPSHYICQYSSELCNFSNKTLNLTNGCIEESDDERSWYEARNQCLMTGGDLAALSDSERYILRRYFMHGVHWIGLTKYSWRWNLNKNASEEDEIKYSFWSDDWNSLTGDCISINSSNGKWKAIECSDKLKVVCQRDFDNTSSSKSDGSETLLSVSVQRESRSVSYATFISVVIVGICVIVISNIIVALVVRNYVYQRANASPSSKTAGNRQYEDTQTIRGQANPDATYTELQLQAVYEEVCSRGNC